MRHGVSAKRMVEPPAPIRLPVEPGTRPNRVMVLPWRPGLTYLTATEPHEACREITAAVLALGIEAEWRKRALGVVPAQPKARPEGQRPSFPYHAPY